MILKSLLQHVLFYVKKEPDEFGCKFLLQCAEHSHQTIEEYVLSIPPESVIEVRDYVPHAFPRKLRTGALQVQKNNLGAWRVDTISSIQQGKS